jgi:hypothetical protein
MTLVGRVAPSRADCLLAHLLRNPKWARDGATRATYLKRPNEIAARFRLRFCRAVLLMFFGGNSVGVFRSFLFAPGSVRIA